MSYFISFFAGLFILFAILYGVATFGVICDWILSRDTEYKYGMNVVVSLMLTAVVVFVATTTMVSHRALYGKWGTGSDPPNVVDAGVE